MILDVTPLSPEDVTAEYLTENLSFNKRCVQICLKNINLKISDPKEVEQSEKDFLKLYSSAWTNSESFCKYIENLGKEFNCIASTRPNRIKKLDRVFEKFYPNRKLPLDILGGKFVVESLVRMYEVSELVLESFKVVAYRDRIVFSQDSEYRDLQFIIDYNGHLSEVKVMHNLIDEIDKYEHKIYELKRSTENFVNSDLILHSPSRMPQLVLDSARKIYIDQLDNASKSLYSKAWQEIIEEHNQNG